MEEILAIQQALALIKADREWDRANPENPICPGCNRRENPKYLTGGICAECDDDILQAATGCRFGTPDVCTISDHPDCYEVD